MKKLILSLSIAFITLFTFAQVQAQEEQAEFYYGSTCPFCKSTLEELRSEELDLQLIDNIEYLEVFGNTDNSDKLDERASQCGINPLEVGVPFLFFREGCYTGTDQILPILRAYAQQVNPEDTVVSLQENGDPITSPIDEILGDAESLNDSEGGSSEDILVIVAMTLGIGVVIMGALYGFSRMQKED